MLGLKIIWRKKKQIHVPSVESQIKKMSYSYVMDVMHHIIHTVLELMLSLLEIGSVWNVQRMALMRELRNPCRLPDEDNHTRDEHNHVLKQVFAEPVVV